MEGIVENTIFTSATVWAAVLSHGLGAVVAELAEPLVVLAAFAAMFAIVLTATHFFVANLALRAMHLVVESAVHTESAPLTKQVFIFCKASLATETEVIFMAVEARVFVFFALFFYKQTIAAIFAESFVCLMTLGAVAALKIAGSTHTLGAKYFAALFAWLTAVAT